jgi:sterol 3beta-glucosyltransferase
MRIAVLSLGSRGDVQPLVALAAALAKRGHAVRLLSHANFAALAAGRGVAFDTVAGDFRVVLSGEDGRRLIASGRNPLAAMRAIRAIAREEREWWTQIRDRSAGADVLISGTASFGIAASLAESRNIPWVHSDLAPLAPTRAFPSPILPPPVVRLPGWANWLHHHGATQLLWQSVRRSTDDFRREIFGLPAWPRLGPFARLRAERRLILNAFSEHVITRPADWGPELEVTGYWFIDSLPDWQPPPDLVRFLEAGPSPVYVGFGSMGLANPRATAALVAEAVASAQCRAVIGAGWGNLRPPGSNDNVYVVDDMPHDWLFPRMAAAVHHCGAGTTASALRAGVPSVAVPFMADQFFWAWRLRQLGVATRAIPHAKLTPGALAAALRQALDDPEMRTRARDLGARIRVEDGLSRAVDVIERHLSRTGYDLLRPACPGGKVRNGQKK